MASKSSTNWLGRKRKPSKREQNALDMREYIQSHLDLWGLGKLVAVDGPNRGGRHNDQSWWEIAIKYRPPGNEMVRDIQFYDKRIDIYLGYKRYGGYWNRRNIRLGIAAEGRERQNDLKTEVVWSSSQKELTAGPIAL